MLVIAHKNFEQLVKLIRNLTLHCDKAPITICLHIDSDATLSLDELAADFPADAQVFFVEPRMKINPGGFSVTNLILKLLNTAVNHTRHDYYCLLSVLD